ncbi:hypothetical protein BO78DRAFT_458697 [Aspergillus sclerotiicarbonarius CBS 121057]|uniref:Phytanoyl-CoA dioxygenase n=1 Tax=Aspergillus sclerotiicarbonarius (strain CBS 121057 / IBT 28362) TaxID=1448318 RepID=A0A319EIW7_ASPSB|nr:hypothetical protein BO78DRAFT_458697 [Aspergillus sclerotiicarbonarius CBS 121057]
MAASDVLSNQAAQKTTFGDWRDDFFKKGYTVVKGAIPRERADACREQALDWFQKFPFGFDINDKSTWKAETLPVMMKGGMVLNYCAAHEKWAWEARCEQGVIEPFAKLWGTNELLVSFDAVNITLPGRTDLKWKPWPHVDQSPTRKGLACAQGIINLSQAGPLDGGLQLLQGSSELFERFFKEHPPKPKAADAPGQFDWFGFTLDDVKWFEDHGCTLIKINAEPGDLIIWDSRTVHYASLPQSETIRTIIYATYTPAKLATPEDLAKKVALFHQYEGTTHWPHCNIFGQGKAMRGEEMCHGERDEPLEKPVLTDTVLRLAGVQPY